MIRVLVVDDQPLIRTAVRAVLEACDDLTVCAEAEDGAAAIKQCRLTHPDVVLMDIRMGRVDGIQATSVICADPGLADCRVLILTTFEDDANLVAALRAGASGFIGKGAEPEQISQAVRAIHAGEALLSPLATRALVERYLAVEQRAAVEADSPEAERAFGSLTVREREVLQQVGRGLSNQQIADRFVISPLTVKTHVNRIMSKLAARDRAQLVIQAYEARLVAPGEGRAAPR